MNTIIQFIIGILTGFFMGVGIITIIVVITAGINDHIEKKRAKRINEINNLIQQELRWRNFPNKSQVNYLIEEYLSQYKLNKKKK